MLTKSTNFLKSLRDENQVRKPKLNKLPRTKRQVSALTANEILGMYWRDELKSNIRSILEKMYGKGKAI